MLHQPAAQMNNALVAASYNPHQFANPSGLDLAQYYDLANNATIGEDAFQRDIATSAIAATKKYLGKQEAVVTGFVEAAAENPSLAKFVELIPDPNPSTRTNNSQELAFVVLLRGVPPDRMEQKLIMNKLLVNFFFKCRRLDGKPLAPSTWGTNMRTLLATFKIGRAHV